jgi:cell wall-associated NlpC family hydrolase
MTKHTAAFLVASCILAAAPAAASAAPHHGTDHSKHHRTTKHRATHHTRAHHSSKHHRTTRHRVTHHAAHHRTRHHSTTHHSSKHHHVARHRSTRHHAVHRHHRTHHVSTAARIALRGREAVALARSYLGVPYVYGGSSRGGVDCSGLVMAVYRSLGVSFAHYTGSQWHEGNRVPAGHLEPGDLVFFDGSYAPQHVGIYVGGGTFIHAPHSGTDVQYGSLGSSWFASEYVGAVRPRL